MRLKVNVKNPRENRCFQTVIVFSFGSVDNLNKCTVLWKMAAKLIAVGTSVNNEMWVKLSCEGREVGAIHISRGSWGRPHFPGARGLVALSLTESGWPFPFRSFRPTAGRRAAKKTLIFPKTRSPARTSDPACRILRVAGQLLGNLDAVRSAAAVRPGTTRKVEVRVAWRANALGLKSVRTKPKSQGGKAI